MLNASIMTPPFANTTPILNLPPALNVLPLNIVQVIAEFKTGTL